MRFWCIKSVTMCEAQSAIHETLQYTSLQSKELQHISVQVHCKVVITRINAVLMQEIPLWLYMCEAQSTIWNITRHKFVVKRAAALSWYTCTARLQLTFYSQKELQYILVQVHWKVTVDSLESKQQQQILVQVHWKVTVYSQMLMQYILVQAHCKITVATLPSN